MVRFEGEDVEALLLQDAGLQVPCVLLTIDSRSRRQLEGTCGTCTCVLCAHWVQALVEGLLG